MALIGHSCFVGQSQANTFLNWFSRRSDQISTRSITPCDREYVTSHAELYVLLVLVTRPTGSSAATDMQMPPIIQLEKAAKKLVWAAKKKGTLKFVHKYQSHDNNHGASR